MPLIRRRDGRVTWTLTVRLRVITLDGSTISAAAAKHSTGPCSGCGSYRARAGSRRAAAAGAAGCAGHGYGEGGAAAGAVAGSCRGWAVRPGGAAAGMGRASRNERIAAALADLEAAREAEDAARRAAAEACLAKARAGQAPPGRIPEEAAVAVAKNVLEQAARRRPARCDAGDQRLAASAGRAYVAPGPPRRNRPRRRDAGNGWPRTGGRQGQGRRGSGSGSRAPPQGAD